MASDETLRKLQRDFAKLAGDLDRVTGTAPTVLFKDFAAQYLDAKQANPELRDSTKRAFAQTTVKHLIPAFGPLPLHSTDWKAEFNAWVKKTRKANEGNTEPHVRRFFNHRKDLKEILLAAFKAGHIGKSPELDNPDEKRDTGREMTQAEIVALLWKARRPFRVIFLAFFLTGCRPREVLQWEWTMLRRDEDGDTWVNVPARITKVDTSRSIPLLGRLSYILHIRERHGNRSVYIFPRRGDPNNFQFSFHWPWNDARIKAGVKKCTPYDLRRTRASLMARAKVEISTAGKLLGTSPTMLHNLYIKHNAAMMKAGLK